MVNIALLCCLSYFICNSADWFTCLQVFKRPLVVAPLTGLLLGDLQTGVVMGASLEGIFMGISAIGGSLPADYTTGSIIAVAYTIATGTDMEAGLAIAMPIGTLISSFGSIFTPLFAATSVYWEKLAATGNMKKFIRENVLFTLIGYNIITLIILFCCVAFGTTALESLLASLPAFIMTGLGDASALMMGLGYAILLSMLWSKEISYFFIVGYVLTVYFSMSTLGIALIGTVIAVSVFMLGKRDIELKEQIKNASKSLENKEEEFF